MNTATGAEGAFEGTKIEKDFTRALNTLVEKGVLVERPATDPNIAEAVTNSAWKMVSVEPHGKPFKVS